MKEHKISDFARLIRTPSVRHVTLTSRSKEASLSLFPGRQRTLSLSLSPYPFQCRNTSPRQPLGKGIKKKPQPPFRSTFSRPPKAKRKKEEKKNDSEKLITPAPEEYQPRVPEIFLPLSLSLHLLFIFPETRTYTLYLLLRNIHI